MIKALLALLVNRNSRRRGSAVAATPPRTYQATPQARERDIQPVEELARASRAGVLTGFEPKVLREYHAPVSINAKGNAGFGLFQSGFDRSNVYNGQNGEVGFYKALCMTGLVDEVNSYWSVAMPAAGGAPGPDPQFHTDIDCVVVQGSTMYLIDLKYYASGDVTWHSADDRTLLCRDTQTGKRVGKPRKMSRNMAMAQDRFSKLFPQHRIVSYVVLIPTNSGIGNVQAGTAWPGRVPLITLPEMLERIRSAGSGYASADVDATLTALLKD